MSATLRPRCASETERFVEVSVLPVPPFGPRTQTRRDWSAEPPPCPRPASGRASCAPRTHLVRGRREHDDVVCAGLERAPEEAVRRPVTQDHHVQVRVLLGHRVQEQQGAVRVTGAGDEEQVGRMAAQPPQGLFGPGDHSRDVEVGVCGQRVLHVAGVDPGLDDEECCDRAARHQTLRPTSAP